MNVIWKNPQHELINSSKSGNFKRIFFTKFLCMSCTGFLFLSLSGCKNSPRKKNAGADHSLGLKLFQVFRNNNRIKCFYFELESMI